MIALSEPIPIYAQNQREAAASVVWAFCLAAGAFDGAAPAAVEPEVFLRAIEEEGAVGGAAYLRQVWQSVCARDDWPDQGFEFMAGGSSFRILYGKGRTRAILTLDASQITASVEGPEEATSSLEARYEAARSVVREPLFWREAGVLGVAREGWRSATLSWTRL